MGTKYVLGNENVCVAVLIANVPEPYAYVVPPSATVMSTGYSNSTYSSNRFISFTA
jgi:hypothetical protein